jgi:hypothetical protein
VNDGGSKLKQYEETFGLNELYGSFDYRHVHFVTMASESKFDEDPAQYKFIDEDLKKASENKDIDWIVVTSYGHFTHHHQHIKLKKILGISITLSLKSIMSI